MISKTEVERIKLIQGDITELKVDAIVNAANNSLCGGGGVDGAIHSAAGSQLLKECIKLNGCNTGEAKITRGYKLPAKWVIHTVGPIWKGGQKNEDILLAQCYRSSLELAVEHSIQTIAFPSISTGVYSFPVERACRIAVTEVLKFLKHEPSIRQVTFVCFAPDVYCVYSNFLQTGATFI